MKLIQTVIKQHKKTLSARRSAASARASCPGWRSGASKPITITVTKRLPTILNTNPDPDAGVCETKKITKRKRKKNMTIAKRST